MLLAGFFIVSSAFAVPPVSRVGVKITAGSARKGCLFRDNLSISQTDIYGPSHKDKENGQLNI